MKKFWADILLIVFYIVLCCLTLNAQPQVDEITKIAQLRSLKHNEATNRYPVNITATVLWANNNGDSFFVSDDSGSIYVRVLVPKVLIKPGALVKIRGVSDPGQLTPYIRDASIVQIGIASFPVPEVYPIDRILTGEADARWVETEGTVRYIQQTSWFLIMGIQQNGRVLDIRVQSYPTNYSEEF